MISSWLDLPLFALFGTLALFYALPAALIYGLTFHSPLSACIKSYAGVVAPYFGAIGLLFGLLTGFLANDIADRNRQAARSLTTETDALHSVQTLSIASASDMSDIRTALRAYAQSVLADEWKRMADDGRATKTEAAFEDLLHVVANPSIARDSGQAVHGALLAAVTRIGSARSDRLAISADRTTAIKWLTVLLLGIMTQIAIGLVHLDKPRAQAAALTVFSVAVVIALGLIGTQEQPFAGAIQISPWPIEDFLATTAPQI